MTNDQEVMLKAVGHVVQEGFARFQERLGNLATGAQLVRVQAPPHVPPETVLQIPAPNITLEPLIHLHAEVPPAQVTVQVDMEPVAQAIRAMAEMFERLVSVLASQPVPVVNVEAPQVTVQATPVPQPIPPVNRQVTFSRDKDGNVTGATVSAT